MRQILRKDALRAAARADRRHVAVGLRQDDRRARNVTAFLFVQRVREDRVRDPHRLLDARIAFAVHDDVAQVDEDDQVVRLPHVVLERLDFVPQFGGRGLLADERVAVHLAREVEARHLAHVPRPQSLPLPLAQGPVKALHHVVRRGGRPFALPHARDLVGHVRGGLEVLRTEEVTVRVRMRVQVP